MLGMLSGLDRKNCPTIAERRGDLTPDGMQHLLARARWDADAVRDDLRDYVMDAFADPHAVLVVDETGDVKKGVHSVGVQRQYSGTAGRIENVQVAVYLTYAARGGHALIDRALYLPRSWTQDRDRCAAAGVPDDIVFATKPALATGLIRRAVAAGVPAGWVAGGEVYGADPTLRRTARRLGLGYVLQVAANRRVPTQAGPIRVDQLPALLPDRVTLRSAPWGAATDTLAMTDAQLRSGEGARRHTCRGCRDGRRPKPATGSGCLVARARRRIGGLPRAGVPVRALGA